MFTGIKKYFSKIACILLVVVMFPMANSFCFQNINGSMVDMDACGSHENSLLPCCIDGSHPVIIAASQLPEMEKFVPAVFSSDIQTLKITFKNVLYTQPIISPPKLIAVNTTILRL